MVRHWAMGGSKIHLIQFWASELWMQTDGIRLEGTLAAWVALGQLGFGATLLVVRVASRLAVKRRQGVNA
jgi:hypothetical protein